MRTTGKHCSTPQHVFDYAVRVYGPFDVDIAAEAWNAKCPKYVTKEMNALAFEPNHWKGRVWCNPPWDNIYAFINAAMWEVEKETTDIVVMLLPARAGRDWWRWVEEAGYTRLGRIQFGSEDNSPGKGGFEDCVLTAFTPPFKKGRRK